MKSFYYILLFLGMPFWLLAQTTGQNYIVTTVPIAPVSNPTTLTDANSSSNSNSSIQYFDGLGRPMQTVQKAITPSGKDLVNFTEYDAVGRDYKHWLPAPATGSTGASVNSNDFTGLANTQYTSSEKPYTTTEFESSPLNRVTGQYGAGTAWYTATKKTGLDYKTNAANEVTYFTVNTSNQLVRGNGTTNYYDANTLYKTVATDEDVKPTTEYKDKLGQVVLKRQICNGGNVETYYVYNDLGQLCYVLPPNFIDGMGSTTLFDDANVLLKQFGYLYRYDKHGNCNFKRLPGCEPILMVYDLADRLVASQDGNQKLNDKWTVNKYDVFNRVVYTYIATNSLSEIVSGLGNNPINETPEANETTGGYTLTGGIPVTAMLTVNYYDNYSFIPSGNNLNYDSSQEQNGYTPYYSNAKGLLTGTRVYHLDNPSLFETTAIYYDKYGRVVQTRATNHLLGYDIVYNELKFTGAPARTYKTHGINGASATITELYTYGYNKAQQPTTTMYSLNGGNSVTLSVNNYDELGRVSAKILGGINATTYSYNVRSWTTDIIGSRFSENIYYNANPLSSSVCFNGNIAGMQWSVPNEGLGYNRAYTFVYDGLNRLTDAIYTGFSSGVINGTQNRYDEHFGFDKMGNFTALTRIENGSLLNNLSFTYIGNHLKKVDNSISPYIPYGSEAFNDKQKIDTEYSYDQNGSTKWDVNTGISLIQYNLLNLPDQIQFTEGHKNMYTYDASGRKLEAVNYTVHNIVNVPINTISPLPANSSDYTKLTTDYIGNMIYENGSLKQILLPEGYYQGGVYYYYLKDHLGNNRVVINSSGAVIEKSHYYPSGMRFSPKSTSNSAALPYQYNGKELEAMNGLNQYDYGARRRGAGLPIWTAVDPLAEKCYSISPYTYCAGNPVSFIDPYGESLYLFYYATGNTDPNADKMFLYAAMTRALDVLKSKDYNSKEDHIVIKGISNLDNLGSTVEEDVTKFGGNNGFGQTKEFGLWSHSGLDGPTLGENQINKNDLSDINFNWGKGATANFYGCRGGKDPDDTTTKEQHSHNPFVQDVSQLSNMQGVAVGGQTHKAYASSVSDTYKPVDTSRTPYYTPVYMVGQDPANHPISLTGIIARGINSLMPTSVYPMAVYKNGQLIGYTTHTGATHH